MESWQIILAVQNMQTFIEKNIRNPITLNQLAKAAGYSPFYSARIFKDITGKTPFDYIRSLRLSLAAVQLRDKANKVIDVAFDFVFDSHEGFTRAFTREFGMSPKEYKKTTENIKMFLPENIRNLYLTKLKGEPTMSKKSKSNTVFVQVVDRPRRKMVLRRGTNATHYFEYCQEVGCDVWDELSQIKEAINEPMGLWLPNNLIKPNTSIYAQGVEVPLDFNKPIPEGCEIIELPPCQMLIFQGPPYPDEKFEDAISDLWEVMSEYKPEVYGYKYADSLAPRFQLMPMGYRGYIEGRPVEKV